ncbi:MAG TPA: pilin [Limnobacter sp.]|nr:pilin [Limnobacter sp.]
MNSLKRTSSRRLWTGFTLIELMIGIAIIGVLSAIAIPAFQDYLNRAKVTELINLAQSCKAGVVEYTATTNRWPQNASEAGCQSNIAAQSQYARELTIAANGRIQVNFKAGSVAAGIADTHFIALVPWRGTGRHTDPLQAVGEWRCVTNLDVENRRYLPASCRNDNVS